MVVPFSVPAGSYESVVRPTSSSTLGMVRLFLIMILIYVSFMISDVELPFICVLALVYILLEELIQIFVHKFLGYLLYYQNVRALSVFFLQVLCLTSV